MGGGMLGTIMLAQTLPLLVESAGELWAKMRRKECRRWREGEGKAGL